MNQKVTEQNYYLHTFTYMGALEFLKEEIKDIEATEEEDDRSLWYHSGKETLERLEKGKELIEKGVKGGLSLTPYDVNNIVYVLAKRLEE